MYAGIGRYIRRFFCHYLDLIFLIGVFLPIFDQKNQTFADKICNTMVGRKKWVPPLEHTQRGYKRDSLSRG